MDRGTYSASSAGLAHLRRLELINNNLANINTPGFKRELLVADAQPFSSTLASEVAKKDPFAKGDHDRTPGVVNLRAVTDFSPGGIKNTGNPLDVALRNPKDFFVVQGPDGPLYTRAGNFTLDAQGQIVTMDGTPVEGDGGPITVNAPGVSITNNGAVMTGSTQVGRLQVVRFEDTSGLEHVAGTRFKTRPGTSAPIPVEAEVVPGALEMANVSAISSMVDLIATNRAFSAYVHAAQTIDQLNQTAIGQIGRSR